MKNFPWRTIGVLLILLVVTFALRPKISTDAPMASQEKVQPERVESRKHSNTSAVVVNAEDGSVIIHDKGASARMAPISEKSPTPVLMPVNQAAR